MHADSEMPDVYKFEKMTRIWLLESI
jgi:hypothetical protein